MHHAGLGRKRLCRHRSRLHAFGRGSGESRLCGARSGGERSGAPRARARRRKRPRSSSNRRRLRRPPRRRHVRQTRFPPIRDSKGTPLVTWGWVAVGAGGAALGGALAFEILRRDAENDARHERTQIGYANELDSDEFSADRVAGLARYGGGSRRDGRGSAARQPRLVTQGSSRGRGRVRPGRLRCFRCRGGSEPCLGSRVSLTAGLVATGCMNSLGDDLNGKACTTSGRCLTGYVCDLASDICVPQNAAALSGSADSGTAAPAGTNGTGRARRATARRARRRAAGSAPT